MKTLEKIAARSKNYKDNPPVLIACVGDSVTHGAFELSAIEPTFRPEEAYPALLQRRLRDYYPTAAVSVLNAGVAGENARYGLKQLESDVLRHSPDLVTVNFGLNDVCGGLEKLPDYAHAMERTFQLTLASGAECMLVTPNHLCTYVDPIIQDPHMRDYAAFVAKLQNDGVMDAYVAAAKDAAKRCGVPVADANARWNALAKAGVDTTKLLANRINHPCAKAHAIFVEAIIEQLLDE